MKAGKDSPRPDPYDRGRMTATVSAAKGKKRTMEQEREGASWTRLNGLLHPLLVADHQRLLHGDAIAVVVGGNEGTREVVGAFHIRLALVTG